MFKGSIFKALVVMGCSVLVTLPVYADISTSAAESMSEGDAGSDFDILDGGIFGFTAGTVSTSPGPYWGAEILFSTASGAFCGGVACKPEDLVLDPSAGAGITLNFDNALARNCTVEGVSTSSTYSTTPIAPPTTIGSPEFVGGEQTAITCKFDTPYTPPDDTAFSVIFHFMSGDGSLVADSSKKATLDFLASSPSGSTSAVPEPASMGVCLLGLAGFALARRRINGAQQ